MGMIFSTSRLAFITWHLEMVHFGQYGLAQSPPHQAILTRIVQTKCQEYRTQRNFRPDVWHIRERSICVCIYFNLGWDPATNSLTFWTNFVCVQMGRIHSQTAQVEVEMRTTHTHCFNGQLYSGTECCVRNVIENAVAAPQITSTTTPVFGIRPNDRHTMNT